MKASTTTSVAGFFIFALLSTLLASNLFAQPDHIWSRSFGGSQPDHLLDMAFDPAGNVYTTGFVLGLAVLSDDGDTLHEGTPGNRDIILNKYSPLGELLWSRVWAASGPDEGRALSIGSDGQVYLTGIFQGTINFGSEDDPLVFSSAGWSSDAFLMKIDADGSVQWVRVFGGNLAVTGNGVAVADDGDVVMCGRFVDSLMVSPELPNFTTQTASDGNRVFIAKFSDQGDFIWIERMGGAAGQAPKAFKATPDGGFIMAGDFIGTLVLNPGAGNGTFTSTGSDLYVAKFDAEGSFDWARSIGNAGWEFTQDVDIFPNGDIAITGSFTGTINFGEVTGEHVLTSTNDSDIFIARLSAEGNTIWAHSAGGNASDEGLCVAVDDLLNVHIGGVFRQVMTFSNGADFSIQAGGAFQVDAFLASYSSSGAFQWATAFDCPFSAEVKALAAGGNFIALGGRFGGEISTDYEATEATLFSLFNGTSTDAFVAYYQVREEPVEPCTANGGALEAPANRSFCVGTGSPQGIQVTAVGASGSLQRWALINADGDIVATRANNSLFNLDTFAPGNYSIRHMRYEAPVGNLSTISNVSQIDMLTGCFSISSNAINVFLRDEPEPGLLSADGPTQVCANDGPATAVALSVSGNSSEFGLYGLVNLPGQTVIASNTSGSFDLNGLPAGPYLGVHLSYEQGVQLAGVSNASQLQGCYALSNSVPITIVDCGGLVLQANPNPTEAMSRISFGSAIASTASLELFDMSGRLVASLWRGEMQPEAPYQYELNSNALPNGVYLLRLSTQEEVKVHKLVLGY